MAEKITPRGVRITYPSTLDVQAASELPGSMARGTAATRAPGGGDWSVLLREAGFDVVDKLKISGNTRAALRAGPPSAAPAIEVPVEPGQEALLLVESDGVYHWEYPSAAAAASSGVRRLPGAARTRRFVLHTGAAPRADGPAMRGPIFDWISGTKIFHAIVVRFILGPTAATIAGAVDGDGPFGLCAIAGDDAAQWRPTGAPLPPAPNAKKVLLLVHGTFSSTRGSFADLLTHDEGRNFLAQAHARYDLVLGFEHPTLSAPTTENARILADELEQMQLPKGATIDAVAFSRGGLVLRGLFEQELKARGDRLPIVPGKAVFVGCTNGGTHLADSRNWGALTDLYTTLALSTAGATAGVPVLGAASTFAATAVPVIGRLVQSLAIAAVQDNYVPGLASMLPDGDVVRALNVGAGKKAAPGYYAITANYNPGVEGQANSNGALKALNQIADDLFVAENDLVVDTKLMTTFWPKMQTGAVEAFGDTHDVFHTSYFASPRVARKTAEWLGMTTLQAVESVRGPLDIRPSDASSSIGGGRRTRGMAPLDAAISPGVESDGGAADFSSPPVRPRPRRKPAAAAVGEPRAAPAAMELEGALVSCDVAASMPPTLPVGAQTSLSITVSRGSITINEGPAAAMEHTKLQAEAPLTVIVRAIANCALIDDQGGEQTSLQRQMSVPKNARGTNVENFSVKGGAAPGEARLVLSASQDGKPVVEFELRPQITPATGLLEVQQSGRLSAVPAPSTLLMRIYQSKADDKWNLRFVVDCPEVGLNLDDSCTISIEPTRYAGEQLAAIEQIVASKGNIKARTSRLAAHGLDMSDGMIPEKVRKAIWENRDRIGAIQVISDEAPLPWELACVRGSGDETPLFLAEFGLVRWIKNVPWPAQNLRLRGERMKYLAPVYEGDMSLPGAQAEVAEFQKMFPKAKRLVSQRDAWAAFIAGKPQLDVLHIACHGAAAGGAAGEVGLYLSENQDDLFDHRELRQTMILAADCKPVVFLNACQTGRQVGGIAEIDSFAKAFLKPAFGPGAAALVVPLWSVGDISASTFAMTFYDRLRKNDTVVDAVRAARIKACETDTQLTWLSYSIYADPFAKVVEPVWSEEA